MSVAPPSAEIVNLRMARKRKARESAETEAASRRAQFALSKGQKRLAAALADRAARELDAHRIVPSPGDVE
jgi:hypothetical protein